MRALYCQTYGSDMKNVENVNIASLIVKVTSQNERVLPLNLDSIPGIYI